MGKKKGFKTIEIMKEIINHVEGILQNYNLTFNELNDYSSNHHLLEASDPANIQSRIRRKFHKTIGLSDAKELEILLLTYNYISHN